MYVCMYSFPDLEFLESQNRRLCFDCGFAYSRRFEHCRRSLGVGESRCCGVLVEPRLSLWLRDILSATVTSETASVSSNPPLLSSIASSDNIVLKSSSLCLPQDAVLEGPRTAAELSGPRGDEHNDPNHE